MSRIAGRATAEGTRAFIAAHGAPSPRSARGLTLSSVGLGTYLGDETDEVDALYRASIAAALDAGINVLDTAINYRSQRSERAISAVLGARIRGGTQKREEIFVASKAGYVPHDGNRVPSDHGWLERSYLGPGIIPRDELVGGVHCMAPRFLEDQIERSRNNLGLETIDLYYLHNPESGMEGLSAAQFDARVRAAFDALERAVGDGRIGHWGVATWNGLRKPPGVHPHQSLLRFIELAEEVGGADHHFKFVQLPYNLAYIEAHSTPTQEQRGTPTLRPFLDAAREHGVYVFASASLLQGQLIERLPPDISAALGLETDAQRSLQFVRSTPGIGTALVGTKRVGHVAQMAAVERAPIVPPGALEALFDDQ